MKFKLIPIDKGFFRKWLLFSLGAGLTIPLFYYPQGYTSLEGLSKVWDDMLYSFGISLGISGSVGLVEVNLNHYVPWIKAPVKRFFFRISWGHGFRILCCIRCKLSILLEFWAVHTFEHSMVNHSGTNQSAHVYRLWYHCIFH